MVSQMLQSDVSASGSKIQSSNGTAKPIRSLGLGAGKSLAHKRHRKIIRDTIQGITKPDIRRMARRGGVKRISADVYSSARAALRFRLEEILQQVCLILENRAQKTVTTTDVVFVLNRMGNPIYGFGGASRV